MFKQKQIEFSFFTSTSVKKRKKISIRLITNILSVVILSQLIFFWQMLYDADLISNRSPKQYVYANEQINLLISALKTNDDNKILNTFAQYLSQDRIENYVQAGKLLEHMLLNINQPLSYHWHVNQATYQEMLKYYQLSVQAKQTTGFTETQALNRIFTCSPINLMCKIINYKNTFYHTKHDAQDREQIRATQYNLAHPDEFLAWMDELNKTNGYQNMRYVRSPGERFVKKNP